MGRHYEQGLLTADASIRGAGCISPHCGRRKHADSAQGTLVDQKPM